MEEIREHPQLLQLEAATLADVDQFGACSLTDKARVQKLSLSIQGKLSQIRALTRDLELLVEELDRRGGLQGLMTTASWLTALPPVQLARCVLVLAAMKSGRKWRPCWRSTRQSTPTSRQPSSKPHFRSAP
jgi:hypothetical protein